MEIDRSYVLGGGDQGYDALIKAELDNVEDYKKQVKNVKTEFRAKARTIGLESITTIRLQQHAVIVAC